jgi:hypothetical protein
MLSGFSVALTDGVVSGSESGKVTVVVGMVIFARDAMLVLMVMSLVAVTAQAAEATRVRARTVRIMVLNFMTYVLSLWFY